MQKPIAEKGETCPLWKRDVSKVCHKCPWWVQVRGRNPQGEDVIDHWGCAIAFGPMLLINAAAEARGGAAATESFRNAMVSLALEGKNADRHLTKG